MAGINTALQTNVFAAFDLHAKLQAFQSVQPIDPLLDNRPTLALEHDKHAQIAKSWTVHCSLPDAQAQGTLITSLAFLIPNRRAKQRQPMRTTDTHVEALLYPGCQLTPLDSLQRFFRTTSCRTARPASSRPRSVSTGRSRRRASSNAAALLRPGPNTSSSTCNSLLLTRRFDSYLTYRRAQFGQPQCIGDLFFGKPRFLHHFSMQPFRANREATLPQVLNRPKFGGDITARLSCA